MRFAFPYPPQPGHLVGILDDELPVVALPGDHPLILLLLQQLQNEVPELDLSGAGARLGLVGPVWKSEPWKMKRTRSRPAICPAVCQKGQLSP